MLTKAFKWCLLTSLISASIIVTSQQVVASALRSTANVPLHYDLGNKMVPNWSGGALVVVEGESTPTPLVRSFDATGHQISLASFSIPGARLITVHGFSRGADGTLAICGDAFHTDGRVAPYLAILSANGEDLQIVRPFPYHPHRAVVASDGTVWTLGIEDSEDPKIPFANRINPIAGAIRRFDKSGKLLESLPKRL